MQLCWEGRGLFLFSKHSRACLVHRAPCHTLGTQIWAQTISVNLMPVILVFLCYCGSHIHSRVFIEHLQISSVLGTGAISVNRTKSLSSWSFYSSVERQKIKKKKKISCIFHSKKINGKSILLVTQGTNLEVILDFCPFLCSSSNLSSNIGFTFKMIRICFQPGRVQPHLPAGASHQPLIVNCPPPIPYCLEVPYRQPEGPY